MIALRRVLATSVATVALAGCSTGGGSGAAAPPTGPVLPPRPASVAADRIRPCTMLTTDQASVLGLRRPTPALGTVDGVPSAGCTWLGAEVDVNVQFIPIGTEVAATVPESVVTRVNGYGAVRNMPDVPGSPPICQVVLDVAPGASIRVQASPLPDAPYGIDELCRRADEAASMVMTTVVAAAPR